MRPVERFAYLLALVLSVAGSFRLGQHWPKVEPITVEAAAPENRRGPGDLVLERKPAPELAPKLDKETSGNAVRRITFEAVPEHVGHSISIELLQFATPEGIRTEVKSENGRVLGGLDQPIRPLILPAQVRPWTVQVTRQWNREGWEWGALASYSRGPWVVSVGGSQHGGIVGVGVRF